MIRTFVTSDEQDAAIAWKVAQLNAQGTKTDEAMFIAGFATVALRDLVTAYRDDEASKVYEAFKSASLDDRAAAKTALKL